MKFERSDWPWWTKMGRSLPALILAAILATALGSGKVWAVDTWTKIGPDGGPVSTLVIDPQNPLTIYLVASGGLFKSANGGTSWSTAAFGLPANSVSRVVIDPQNSAVYVVASSALFKSTDGAASWQAVNSELASTGVDFVSIDPQNSRTIYGAFAGGLFKSTDGGTTWRSANSGLITNRIETVVIDPQNTNTVYAGTFNGVFKSIDGGMTWNAANTGPMAIQALVIDPRNPSTMYAGTFNGVSKSIDGGASWSAVNSGLPRFLQVGALAIDPQNPSTVYAGPRSGLFESLGGPFKSTDGGASWSAMNSGLPRFLQVGALAIDPQNPSTIYVGTAGFGTLGLGGLPLSVNPGSLGVFKSTDGAVSWSTANAGLRQTSVYSLAFDTKNPSTIYAVANGSVFKRTDVGASWSAANAGIPDDGIFVTKVVSDSQQSSTFYAIASYPRSRGYIGGVFKSDGGNWKLVKSFGNYLLALAIDSQNPGTIYAGDVFGGVSKSTDAGATWATIFQFPVDCNTPEPVVEVLAVDPQTPGTIYFGGSLGVLKSTDGGTNWNEMNSGLATDFSIGILAIDPQNPSTLYAGSYGRPIFKTMDGGQNWVSLSISAYGLAIDAQNPTTIYAGTDGGVLKSTDGGASWVNSGPIERVLTVGIDPQSSNTVYAGTASGGVFAITFAPLVTDLRVDRTSVVAGASFSVNISGSNLTPQTSFDVRFIAPGSSAANVSLDWQRGLTASHSVSAGTAPGTWTINGVRAHNDEADHTGNFVPVNATITVSP